VQTGLQEYATNLVCAIHLGIVRCVDTAGQHAQEAIQERGLAFDFDHLVCTAAHSSSVDGLCLTQAAHKEGLHVFFAQLAGLAVDVGSLC